MYIILYIHHMMNAHTYTYIHSDPSSINAPYEFSGDRRDVDVGMSDVERKVLQREETIIYDDPPSAATTLLTSGLTSNCLHPIIFFT